MRNVTLALCLWLATAVPAFAMDSTALSDPKILGVNIEQGTSVTPVGTVIAWASGASMPHDAENWLECDGRAIPAGAEYQTLRDILLSNNTPNYSNQFLRGGTAAQVGQMASDSTRSHAHSMDPHQHTVSGTAGGQAYQAVSSGGGGYYLYGTHSSTSESGNTSYWLESVYGGTSDIIALPYASASVDRARYYENPRGTKGVPMGGGGLHVVGNNRWLCHHRCCKYGGHHEHQCRRLCRNSTTAHQGSLPDPCPAISHRQPTLQKIKTAWG